MSEYKRHVLSVLQVVFPDARLGGEYSTKEAPIEGLPVWAGCEEFSSYPALFSLVESERDSAEALGDGRPVAFITRKKGSDPLVVFSLTDFASFCERNLFAPVTAEHYSYSEEEPSGDE